MAICSGSGGSEIQNSRILSKWRLVIVLVFPPPEICSATFTLRNKYLRNRTSSELTNLSKQRLTKMLKGHVQVTMHGTPTVPFFDRSKSPNSGLHLLFRVACSLREMRFTSLR